MLVDVRPPHPNPHKPNWAVPPKACDTHFHIFGPFDLFPLKSSVWEREYNPTEFSTLEHYLALQKVLGFERGVTIFGYPHGRYHNEVIYDAIARTNGRIKGIGHLDSLIDQKELERMAASGFAAYRISRNYTGSEFFHDAERTADRVRDFGWHVEVQLRSTEEAVELLAWLPKLRLPYVLDHCARARPERGTDDPAFRKVLDHLKGEEDCWVNLYSFYQLSAEGPPHYADVIPIVAALVEACPDRVVWGSNWPHSMTKATPDDGDLVDFILAAIPDPEHRRRVLADNPARLYNFWEE